VGGDAGSIAVEMTPYISAAVGAYGGAVLAKMRDEAADATVGLGRRLLQLVFGQRDVTESLPEPLVDLAVDPRDADGWRHAGWQCARLSLPIQCCWRRCSP
jgi:hypothetical protein